MNQYEMQMEIFDRMMALLEENTQLRMKVEALQRAV